MSLADYLARNYLTADNPSSDPSRPKKKRKKHHTSEPTTGLLIADDDDELSLSHSSNALLSDDPDAPITYGGDSRLGGGRSAEFRKTKTSGWKTLGESAAQGASNGTARHAENTSDEADFIILAAAREEESRRLAEEAGEAPTIVEQSGPGDRPRPGVGGLQTAAETRALEEARVAEQESDRKARKKKTKGERDAEQEETVYRDATGRRIDIHLKRAEARKLEEEAKRKEREDQEKLTGDVQRAQREQRQQDLEDAKLMKLSRYADDEDLNKELKKQERWGDTMAGYIEREAVAEGRSITSTKPIYKGSFEPNRYGIRPGYRWDGVDRSTGFEKQWFQARGKQERNRDLEYQWQMDE
ncbi:putative cell cycle control protein [Phaeomoniella chlamydospora]|uniref:Putative cell cycle control protein n=1 Tax=Phaeomoniella chlamydospora TaxID=158046 RepID=A0A0G2EWR2_PHACM|nr:putative cell cycle control protein [Phaeomoniella chlamydospora]